MVTLFRRLALLLAAVLLLSACRLGAQGQVGEEPVDSGRGVELDCTDGLDDDGDGLIDCEDEDCEAECDSGTDG